MGRNEVEEAGSCSRERNGAEIVEEKLFKACRKERGSIFSGVHNSRDRISP